MSQYFKLYNAEYKIVLSPERQIFDEADNDTLRSISALFTSKHEAERIQQTMITPRFELVEVTFVDPSRNYDKQPRRVVMTIEFFVYDGAPIEQIKQAANTMPTDAEILEVLLNEFADHVSADSAINTIACEVHDS